MGIISGFFRYDLNTSDVWLKLLLNTLVYRGAGISSSGWRGVAVGIKTNSLRKVLGGCVGMEWLNGAVDGKYLVIRRFSDRINIGLVSLVGCAFN